MHASPHHEEQPPGQDLAAAEVHCLAMLDALGIAGAHDGRTAGRHVRALAELTRGLAVDPCAHLGVQFPPTSDEVQLIAAHAVPFTSVCEHHVLPFWGHATVAYLPKPGAAIVGLSKLARLVADYAARPQVQERLGEQVVSALMRELPAAGAAVAIRGVHTCMALRGARAGTAAAMLTLRATGELSAGPWAARWQMLAQPLFAPSPAGL